MTQPSPIPTSLQDPNDVSTLLNDFMDNLPDEFNLHEASNNFRQMLEMNYPAAWNAYAEFHWQAHFGEMIRRRLSTQRAAVRKREIFSVAGKRVNEQNTMGRAQTSYASAEQGVIKLLLLMTKADLLHEAERRESVADTNKREAFFLRVLSKKLTGASDQTVGDVWKANAIDREAKKIFGAASSSALGALVASA